MNKRFADLKRLIKSYRYAALPTIACTSSSNSEFEVFLDPDIDSLNSIE